jgi:NDP-sugar pyrophosphorylase family protein
LNVLPEGRSALRPAWRKAEENAALYGYYYDGLWTDMGTPEGLEIAQSIVQKPQEEVA